MQIEEAVFREAAFAVDLNEEKIPKEIMQRARWIILDSLGCMLKGMENKKMPETDDDEIIGLTRSMVSTELYEGNRKAVGHPACHILPLMVVQAEKGTLTYKKFITNFIAAYEIAGRWGSAIRFTHDVLGHGTVMISGAAVAEGLYRNCGADDMYELLLLAGSLPEVSVWQSVYDGSVLHDIYAGLSALTARRCAGMIQNGVRSTGKILRSVYEDIMDAQINADALDPSGEFLLASNYFKVHTGCRFIHPFADLMQTELKKGLKKEDISEIHVYTYKKASRLTAQKVPNDLAAKFSIPVSLAVQLEKGVLSPDSIRSCEQDEDVARWSGKIWLHEDEKYNSFLPDVRGGRIEIKMKNGENIIRETFHAAGDFDNPVPFTQEDLIQKFRNNTDRYLTEDEQKKMIDYLILDEKTDRNCLEVFQIFYQHMKGIKEE